MTRPFDKFEKKIYLSGKALTSWFLNGSVNFHKKFIRKSESDQKYIYCIMLPKITQKLPNS